MFFRRFLSASFLFLGALLATFFLLVLIYNRLFFYAEAATADDTVDVNLPIGSTLANSCTDTVNMGAITGTGQSALATNEATCTVVTNNVTGYNLTFVSATTYLENATPDQIAAYTPASAGTPEVWSVASTASEWGARLKSTSTTYDAAKWGTAGTDTYAAKWHNVTNSGGFLVANRTSETAGGGDSQIFQFGAEIGSSVLQPTGTYDVDVTITATTN